MFAILLDYRTSPQAHPDILAAHRTLADSGVACGTIVLSGPRADGRGGVSSPTASTARACDG